MNRVLPQISVLILQSLLKDHLLYHDALLLACILPLLL